MNAKQKKIDNKNLKSEINSLQKTMLNLRFQKSTGQLEKTSEIKKTRRKIATFKTLMRQQKGIENA
tara:strand:+ start:237 stop:434 length:198 start_codon:yes stop_codon:yes gene_type:complete